MVKQYQPASGARAGLRGYGDAWYVGSNVLGRWYCRLGQNSELRAMIGFSDQNTTATLNSDVPAANFAVFRWSTAASDINWQCITSGDGGANHTITDSGVPGGTTSHRFEIQFLDDLETRKVVFRIDGQTVAEHTTDLPPVGNLPRWFSALKNLTSPQAQRDFYIGWVYVEADR
jgi:hypothetical protein